MTCQEVLRLLYEVIDNEASPIDSEQVKQHLSECGDCSRIYRLEESVDKLLKARANETAPASETLSLKSKVLKELDRIDTEIPFKDEGQISSGVTGTRQPRKTSLPLRLLALAASIIIIIGAVYYGNVLLNHQRNFIPLERAHWTAVNEAVQFDNPNATAEVEARLASDMSMSMAPEIGGFHLIGGRITEVKGVPMTHFLYANDDKYVSLFVTDANNFELPDGLEESKVDIGNIAYFDHDCRGCRLVYHRDGNAMVISASTQHDIDLFAFKPDRGAI